MRFALNQAALAPYARFLLHGVAAELTTAYPEAAFSILGFADPLGTRARNAVLSARTGYGSEGIPGGPGRGRRANLGGRLRDRLPGRAQSGRRSPGARPPPRDHYRTRHVILKTS